MKQKLIAIVLLTLVACQKIETGNTIDNKTLSFIKDLGLLDENEKIIKYYSNYTPDKAGNFFSTKRIAHYWLDKNDSSQTDVSFALYSEITAIDTTFTVSDFDIPYMTITKKDKTSFKVYIDGEEKQKRDFFNEAIKTWKKNK